jgi:hypothetical protein
VRRLVSTRADNESSHGAQSETEFDNLWKRPGRGRIPARLAGDPSGHLAFPFPAIARGGR